MLLVLVFLLIFALFVVWVWMSIACAVVAVLHEHYGALGKQETALGLASGCLGHSFHTYKLESPAETGRLKSTFVTTPGSFLSGDLTLASSCISLTVCSDHWANFFT